MDQGQCGRTIAGKYRIIAKLGEGGMGSVWRAEHLVLRSPVAVKFMSAGIANNAEASTRFLREARAAAALRSPHVVQILDFGFDEEIPFIVMELLEGQSLADRLSQSGRLSPADTSHILTQVARAIGKAHEAGIIHRDLKPENVFLVRNDEEEVAKVLDFGIAKATGGSDLGAATTRSGTVLGTPYYMSPEQVEGAKVVDARADIWSFGVIACECLTGRRPFDGETLGALLVGICARPLPVPSQIGPTPAGFDSWFSAACARELAKRFDSIKLAAAELRRLCVTGTHGDVTTDRGPAGSDARAAQPSAAPRSSSQQALLPASNVAPRTPTPAVPESAAAAAIARPSPVSSTSGHRAPRGESGGNERGGRAVGAVADGPQIPPRGARLDRTDATLSTTTPPVRQERLTIPKEPLVRNAALWATLAAIAVVVAAVGVWHLAGSMPASERASKAEAFRAPVENRGPAVENRGPAVENRGSAVENRGSAVENRGSAVENRGSAVENRGPAVENRGPAVENRGPAVENRGPAVENRGPAVENRGPATAAEPEPAASASPRAPSSATPPIVGAGADRSATAAGASTSQMTTPRTTAAAKVPPPAAPKPTSLPGSPGAGRKGHDVYDDR